VKHLVLTLSLGLAAPASADVSAALDTHILPGFAAFAEAAEGFTDSAAADCRPEALTPAYHAAFDAWMAVADLRIGPSETGALSLSFWPDPRGSTQRALAAMIAAEDPVAFDVAAYAEVSIAARGFFALDMVLFDPAFRDYGEDSYTCALVKAIAGDIARQAEALNAEWSGPFAALLRAPGAEGNTLYLTEDEARRALFTQILSSLEFTANTRLGEPLGTFDRPRPARAEARRSGRPLRNAMLATGVAYALVTAFVGGPLLQTEAAMESVRVAATRLQVPAFQDVTDPQARLRLEVLRQAVRTLHVAIAAEVGAPLGIAPGFNAQDGD
jgi:predicted lipoprotein